MIRCLAHQHDLTHCMALLPRIQCDMVIASGEAIARLLNEMQSEQELFDSPATLEAVEEHLRLMATTLAHLPEPLQMRLAQMDWHGWDRLHRVLHEGRSPRREEVWYGIHALVPATLGMLALMKQRHPVWFELGL